MDSRSIDIAWFLQRCSALLGQTLPATPAQVEALSRGFQMRPEAGMHADDRGVVDELLALLKVREYAWTAEPAVQELPMVAILPGIGCRIVHGRTDEGRWLLEGPGGSHQVAAFPDGAGFAPLHPPAEHGNGGPVFLSIIRETFGANRSVFLKAGVASALGNLFALVISFYSLQVYDRVIPTQGISTLIVLTVGVIMVMGIDLAVKLARSLIMEQYVKNVDHAVSHKIFRRLLGVRMDQFPPSVGSLASQIRGYESIRSFVSAATLYVLFDAPFGLFFLLVILAIAGPGVAFVALAFFGLAIAVGLVFRSRIERHTESSAGFANRKLGLLVDAVDGAEALKASGASWQMLAHWDNLNRQVVENDGKTRHYSELSSYLTAFMQQLSYVLLVATGAWIASTSTSLTTGGIVACAILSGRVLMPIGMLPGLLVQWGHAKIAYDNLERFFALETDNHGVDRPLCPERLRGGFRLNEVGFAYPGQNTAVRIDRLTIAPGEKVGILGVVGSGKSTLLKLLAGLYKPQEGQILLDGLDLHHISRHLLSAELGYLQQHPHLFAGTLRENLLLGLTGIDEEQMMATCRKTGLDLLVSGHPKGLDLPIAEGGAGVSGGQKQLIALTRMLLAGPTICLLDEPTSSMDDGYEKRVLAALGQAMGEGKTLVLVTHKPALLSLVDRLVILTPGGIVMDGPRDEVLRRLQGGVTETTKPESAGGAAS